MREVTEYSIAGINETKMAPLTVRLKRESLPKDALGSWSEDNKMKQVDNIEGLNVAIRPVRQSASKDEFLKALNLDLTNVHERQVFTTMWEEVTQYWVQRFETSSREILKNEYRANFGVRQPYKWGHLSQEAIDQAIADIWKTASERSRWYYDQGQSADPSVKNWVLKWLLWHVSRYRDERNNKRNRSSESSSPGSPYYSPIPGLQIPLRVHDSYLSDPYTYGLLPSVNSSSATSPIASAFSPDTSSFTCSASAYSEDSQPPIFSPVASTCTQETERGDKADEAPHDSVRSEREYWNTVMDGKPSSEQVANQVKRPDSMRR